MSVDFSKYLNQPLLKLLDHLTYGKVKVVNERQQLQYEVVEKNGRRGIKPTGFGSEEYVFDCPMCSDTRQRCYVNYTFGTEIDGIPIYHLINCFNEGCGQKVSKWLREEMGKANWQSMPVPVAGMNATTSASAPAPVRAPLQTTHRFHDRYAISLRDLRPLSWLCLDHPAVKYVTSRKLDVKYLSDVFNVGMYMGLVRGYHPANHRLVVPICFSGSLVGWTARVIPEYTVKPDWYKQDFPKYHNSKGFKMSQYIYNYDRAKDAPVIAVAEGVTDVWKIGNWGMGLFGKSMSDAQCQLLCRAGEDKGAAIVLLADASTEKDDAAKSWTQNFEKLRSAYRYPGRVFLHHMAQGDPGDCSSQELYDLVNNIVHGRKA